MLNLFNPLIFINSFAYIIQLFPEGLTLKHETQQLYFVPDAHIRVHC
jgi:hypothetical protein